MTNKLFGLIGLAKRAGKVISGADAVIDSVRSGKAFVVICAGDSSEATKKKLADKCAFYNAKVICVSSGEALGNAIGKNLCAALSIVDKNFADGIMNVYNSLTEVAENGSC